MAGIFDLIPVITVVMFVLGLVGVMAYERTHSSTTSEIEP